MGKPAAKKRLNRKKGKFHYAKNLKRENRNRQAKVRPTVQSDTMREQWKDDLTTCQNLGNMGLVFDLRKVQQKSLANEETLQSPKTGNSVIACLEKKIESKRKGKFLLPKEQVRWLSNMIDKYGEDYKAMARDPKNYYQETWKQIRGKIVQFQNVPEQYAIFLKERDII